MSATMKRRIEWDCFLPSDGSNSRNAKFTAAQACQIIELAAQGKSVDELAAMFNCVRDTVRNIINGRRYSKQTEATRRKYFPAK